MESERHKKMLLEGKVGFVGQFCNVHKTESGPYEADFIFI